jgi:hypothetical protein
MDWVAQYDNQFGVGVYLVKFKNQLSTAQPVTRILFGGAAESYEFTIPDGSLIGTYYIWIEKTSGLLSPPMVESDKVQVHVGKPNDGICDLMGGDFPLYCTSKVCVNKICVSEL